MNLMVQQQRHNIGQPTLHQRIDKIYTQKTAFANESTKIFYSCFPSRRLQAFSHERFDVTRRIDAGQKLWRSQEFQRKIAGRRNPLDHELV